MNGSRGMEMRWRAALSLLLLCVALSRLYGDEATIAWVREEPVNTYVKALAVDEHGNVYLTGPALHEGGAFYDFYTVAYSAAGVRLWTNRFHGPSNQGDDVVAITTGGGNVYVIGDSVSNSQDTVTIAYSTNGVALWTNRFNGVHYSSPQAIAAASNGNVFVVGGADVGTNDSDYFVVAYSRSGIPLWTNHYTGPENYSDAAHAMALDDAGNLYVTGTSAKSTGFNSYDFATVAYSQTGVALWTNRYSGPDDDEDRAVALTVDSDHNVYVVGNTRGPGGSLTCATVAYTALGTPLWTNRYEPGSEARAIAVGTRIVFVAATTAGYGDIVTIAYSTEGIPLWTNRFNGPDNLPDEPVGIGVDRYGTVYVSGFSSSSDTFSDFITIAYSRSGFPLWTNHYHGPVDVGEVVQAMALDAKGNVCVIGTSYTNWTTIKYLAASPPKPRLFSTSRLVDGGFQFSIEGLPDVSYSIEFSTNFMDWMTLTNIAADHSGIGDFNDLEPKTFLRRFYRAAWTP